MAPCARREAQRVPRQLGVAMGARAADPRCAADPHIFSPASTAAFLRATSCRVEAEQLVVRCAGPADASAGGGLKCAMAALTAFMSCGARAAAAHVRCSPIASGGRVFPVCFGREHIFGDFGTHTKLQWFAMCRPSCTQGNCNGSQSADPEMQSFEPLQFWVVKLTDG
jgi:hypothetical protein